MTRKIKTKKQQFWPGTNIIKSSNNAFDWRGTATGLYTANELSHMQAKIKSQMNASVNNPIQAYSRAKPSSFTNGA